MRKMNARIGNLVSVVIPCYNKVQFVAEAIESVLAQTHHEVEIIVVNDGSLDNTDEVVTRYPMVRLLNQKNQGVSAARNTGLLNSKGAFVVFLDADDRLLPEALEVGFRCMEEHPECAFVSGHVRIIGIDGSFLWKPEESCIQKKHYRELLTGNYIWTPSAVMFRAMVFDEIDGFSILRSGAEDWELYLRIARIFPVYCHNKVVAEYRVEGAMTADPARMLRESLATLRAQWRYVRQNRENQEALRRGILGARKYYGDPLLREVREDIKKSEWRRAIRKAFILLKYCRCGFWNLLFRKS